MKRTEEILDEVQLILTEMREKITDELANSGQAIWTLTFRLNRSQWQCCSSKSHALVKQVTMTTHSEICLDTESFTIKSLEK